jgi:hypothetical protein
MKTAARIKGTLGILRNGSEIEIPVFLDVVRVSIANTYLAISRLELVQSPGIPDGGPYWLRYPNDGLEREALGVYVEHGKFKRSPV